ncbi:stromal processing peptidase, chloroplastic isoform X2 [Physcomitrium patens]|uniref:Uncharacterized protein n=1 Tax=Physcomitrium patens TaxID=3218 RepID=A0A2K1IDD8_PHYPA|nr:stromal processing peptidase, chloroplastic-like isoform X2 [Physcomitrium patens]PNR27287.1 hypothetical protein PHYPA_029439 [Physcomitrium patens]|eukprot:XP_024365471.1 stromal processing peptidase, chloroplastic-like isoform X2 [Physcomitrella patens]
MPTRIFTIQSFLFIRQLLLRVRKSSFLPLVLEALHEIACKPKFLASRIEKERKADLSELQMMNTIEYRVDCQTQLLQHLHSENMSGYRFPIGLEEQIKKWDPETIKAFHVHWYFLANATLFIVGDIGSVIRTVEMIEAQFAATPAGVITSTHTSLENINLTSIVVATLKERHHVRPPLQHTWSLPSTEKQLKKPVIFQHGLLQNISISLFCKTPVQKVQTSSDLRDVLMRRIFLSTLQFCTNTRYKSATPPFNGVELDHSDSGREGCTVSTLKPQSLVIGKMQSKLAFKRLVLLISSNHLFLHFDVTEDRRR